MKLPDKVWAVVLDTLEQFDGIRCDSPELRDYVENHCDITIFDGGAFIADGNEFDLFVVPEKRGKWRIRKEISAFLAKLAETHSKAVIKIYPENKPSLRLAKWFGFKPVGRDGRQIVLERPLWVV
jgi:GNAT superfamily N-acetyltransferase